MSIWKNLQKMFTSFAQWVGFKSKPAPGQVSSSQKIRDEGAVASAIPPSSAKEDLSDGNVPSIGEESYHEISKMLAQGIEIRQPTSEQLAVSYEELEMLADIEREDRQRAEAKKAREAQAKQTTEGNVVKQASEKSGDGMLFAKTERLANKAMEHTPNSVVDIAANFIQRHFKF